MKYTLKFELYTLKYSKLKYILIRNKEFKLHDEK